jgi:hypothetical protein
VTEKLKCSAWKCKAWIDECCKKYRRLGQLVRNNSRSKCYGDVTNLASIDANSGVDYIISKAKLLFFRNCMDGIGLAAYRTHVWVVRL